jgi:hypothetical protein
MEYTVHNMSTYRIASHTMRERREPPGSSCHPLHLVDLVEGNYTNLMHYTALAYSSSLLFSINKLAPSPNLK